MPFSTLTLGTKVPQSLFFCLPFRKKVSTESMLRGSPATTTWHVLRLWPQDMESSCEYIVTCMWGVCRRGCDSWMALLTTYTHDSELQIAIALSLIFTLYKSLQAKSSPSYSVFTRRCLVTALNSGNFSASMFTSLLSGEYITTELSTEL
jgi:hypothetical protein